MVRLAGAKGVSGCDEAIILPDWKSIRIKPFALISGGSGTITEKAGSDIKMATIESSVVNVVLIARSPHIQMTSRRRIEREF